jgi:hypothetical protein
LLLFHQLLPYVPFQVLGETVNGTTYTGIMARTTGAPQNHWFGPAGDPRYVPVVPCYLLSYFV